MISRSDLGRSHRQLLAERDRDNEQAILDDERRLLERLTRERQPRRLRHELTTEAAQREAGRLDP